MKNAFIYFMTNTSHSVLYVGVTSDLARRVFEHKTGAFRGFTSKYNCTLLVHFEASEDMYQAIRREKQLKNWKREWKEALISQSNPSWFDLSETIGVKIAGQARNDVNGQTLNDVDC
jgi:putative endonuclease